MAKYCVTVRDYIEYPEIDANNEEEAKNIAWEWFNERKPAFKVEVTENA